MFAKLLKTEHITSEKPIMAWDGNCGFCHYWVIRWKLITDNAVIYKPYQEVAQNFPDIDYHHFTQAIRFIDTDGVVYGGSAAVFRAFEYGNKYRWLMPLYRKIKPVQFLADHVYRLVSKNRNNMYKVCVLLLGKNPLRQKLYWVIYLTLLALFILSITLLA